MSQLPQNNEDFDNNPEYAKLYQVDDSQQPETDGTDECGNLRLSNLPLCKEHKTVKGVATFSLLFGALGPLTFFLGCWLIFQRSWRKRSAGSVRCAGAECPGYLAGVCGKAAWYACHRWSDS